MVRQKTAENLPYGRADYHFGRESFRSAHAADADRRGETVRADHHQRFVVIFPADHAGQGEGACRISGCPVIDVAIGLANRQLFHRTSEDVRQEDSL